ncbi:MAG: hypothetical protein ACP6IS_05905 [Candidatus Asgardarchaeia archaeon]
MSEIKIKEEINYLKEVFNKLLSVLESISSDLETLKSETKGASSLESRLARIELKLEELSMKLEKAPPATVVEGTKSIPQETPAPEEETPIFAEAEETSEAKVEEIGEMEEIPAEIPSPESPEKVSEVPMPEELPPEVEEPISMDAATIQQKISEYEEELVSIERQISDLEFNYEGGFLDQREYKTQMSALQKRKEELRRKIAELRKRLE